MTINNANCPVTTASAPNTITTVDSLVREARRRGFNIQGGFQPPRLIWIVEAQIAQHNQQVPIRNEHSGDYIEWKQTMDNYQDFLALLRTLPEKLPYEGSPVRAVNDRPQQSGPTPTNEPSSAKDTPNPGTNGTTRQSIENLRKQIDEQIANLPPALQQQLKGVPHPLDQASDPRRTPVGYPSKNASDASPNAPSPTPSPAPQQPPPSESMSERFERERSEYFALVLRESAPAKSPIDDLPPDRQQTLYQLIQDGHPLTAIVKMLAAPEPKGWNFKTCDTSLRRFKKRYEKKLHAAELAAACVEVKSFLAETGHDEQSYMDAARRLLKIRLYKNAADPECEPEELELLIRLLDRQRRTDLAERRVKVAEQKGAQ